MLQWNDLSNQEELSKVWEQSKLTPLLIFKHSNRCSLSTFIKMRLDAAHELLNGIPCYFMDILSYRHLSSQISKYLSVAHESPQALVIFESQCILDVSHLDVNPQEIIEVIHNPTKW